MTRELEVFYIDDDPDDLHFFKSAAASLGVEVQLFQVAEEMLKKLEMQSPTPRVIFIDLNMPAMDGYQLISKIKADDRLASVPVVVLSTASDNRSVTQSRSLGANYFITKPPSITKLKAAIEYAININWNTFKPTYGEFIHKHESISEL